MHIDSSARAEVGVESPLPRCVANVDRLVAQTLKSIYLL